MMQRWMSPVINNIISLLLLSFELHTDSVIIFNCRNHTLQELQKYKQVLLHAWNFPIFHESFKNLKIK
jgi:hypothetical protein